MDPTPRRGDRAAVERAIVDLIRALGLEPGAEPELVTFPNEGGGDGLVVVRDLPFHSLCVHHFVPFFGHAHVAYLPNTKIVGISGAARVLAFYARRPQLQERLGTQIADHLERVLQPRGVAVVLEARHLCMEMRGIRTPGRVETRVARGALASAPWTTSLRLGSGRA